MQVTFTKMVFYLKQYIFIADYLIALRYIMWLVYDSSIICDKSYRSFLQMKNDIYDCLHVPVLRETMVPKFNTSSVMVQMSSAETNAKSTAVYM